MMMVIVVHINGLRGCRPGIGGLTFVALANVSVILTALANTMKILRKETLEMVPHWLDYNQE